MSTRAETEAAAANAEANWRKASDALDKAQVDRAMAIAAWDHVVSVQHKQEVDRRKADEDRRRADATWSRVFPEKRNTDNDRREASVDFVTFSKSVAERHQAYVARKTAEAAWAAAATSLLAAISERDKAVTALDNLNRAQTKL